MDKHDEMIFGLHASTEQALRKLCGRFWRAFSTAGGNLHPVVGQSGMYRCPSLVIHADTAIRVGAEARLVAPKEEVFAIDAVHVSDDGPNPVDRPGQKLLTTVPPDLQLRRFIDRPIHACIWRSAVTLSLEDKVSEIYIDEGVLFQSDEARLFVQVDWDWPLWLRLTTDEEIITAEVNKGWLRPL